MPVMRVAIAILLGAACGGAIAQGSRVPEPKVERIVLQDDNARIEELRVRGQTQRVTVKPKNAAEYEIVATPTGRDPSQNRANSQPGAGGQRVWNLLKF
jgi:hypothetical protein